MVTAAGHGPDTPAIPGEPEPALHVSTDVNENEWDEYVSRHPDATVDHLWRWREIFESVFRHDSMYLAARRGNDVVGALPPQKPACSNASR